MPAGRRTWLGLGALVGVCAGLRLWRLCQQGVWYDEATLLYLSRLGLVARLTPGEASEGLWLSGVGKAPLVGVALAGWSAVFGSGEGASRLLFVLLGSVSVIPLFFLARKLAGVRAAWLAVGLLCLSPFHVYYSRQISEYGPVFLLACCSLLAWLRLVESPGWRRALAMVGLNLAGLLCHPLFVLVPLVQLLAAPCFRWAAGNLVPIGLFGAYGAALSLSTEQPAILLGWIPPLGLDSILALMQQFFHGPMSHGELLDEGISGASAAAHGIFLLLFGVAALLGLRVMVRRGAAARRRLLLLWLLLPPALLAGYSLLVRDLWVPRYLTPLLPLLLVCVAAGVACGVRRSRFMTGGAALLLLLLSAHNFAVQHTAQPQGSVREAVARLKQELGPDDGVICTPDRLALPYAFYMNGDLLGIARLERRPNFEASWLTVDLDTPGFRLEQQPGFKAWRQHSKRVWLLMVRGWPGDTQSRPLRAHLAATMKESKVAYFHADGLDLLLYTPDKPLVILGPGTL